ncbi:MAG: aldolase/citrate lyase family protein [Pseudonocardia sediminis]
MVDRLRAALDRGDPAIGTWCTLPGTWSAEVLGAAGFDWVVADLQHGAPTWETLLPVLQAGELGGAAPVVRVGWNDPASIMRALDLGAAGVIVPMVDDADAAVRAARACRYPPDGDRSFGPLRRRFPDVATANAGVLCLPMIETAAGLGNAEQIAAAPGVDGVFLGPVDLALGLGLGLDPSMRHPDVLAAVDRCVAATRAHGRVVATTASSTEHARDLIARGVAMVTVGSDRNFVATGAARELAALKDDP